MTSPSIPIPANPGKIETYRLIVGSAAEAVELLRERFGDRGRVVSVRQAGGSGFGWLLKKPRLEVLVEIGPERPEPASDPATWPKPVPAPVPVKEKANGTVSRDSAGDVLRAAGLDALMIARIRGEIGPDWSSLEKADVVAWTARFLGEEGRSRPRVPLGRRRVFLGGCGAGKTTALCKMLARDVFVDGRSVAVLKLDADQPNASDGLAAFCEVLGVPMFRSPVEIAEIGEETLLYIDLPGLAAGEELEGGAREALEHLAVDSRILVVNAAYEAELMAAGLVAGGKLGATHVIYTHLDELRGWGKLWRFVFDRELEPLFLSTGPSLAGEMENDPVAALLERTFNARCTGSVPLDS
jgi:flagellar biosynthesis protein FlhF